MPHEEPGLAPLTSPDVSWIGGGGGGQHWGRAVTRCLHISLDSEAQTRREETRAHCSSSLGRSSLLSLTRALDTM